MHMSNHLMDSENLFFIFLLQHTIPPCEMLIPVLRKGKNSDSSRMSIIFFYNNHAFEKSDL